MFREYLDVIMCFGQSLQFGTLSAEFKKLGYEYEVESCMKAIQEGKLECPEMPHAETIRIMKIMDDIRKSWNYEIPCIE